MTKINEQTAYLIGLITGKGYIEENNKVSIEFPFINEYVEGIAHCPSCGFLATKPSDSDFLKCKNEKCSKSTAPTIDPNIKKKYHQPSAFNSSIKDEIVPFLGKGLTFKHTIISNSTCTFLTLELEPALHIYIKNIFHPAISFTSTSIPKEMWDIDRSLKVELVNGLLDSIGFANAGGWIPRDGKNGHGRMRVYFQVINRNYKLPVSIDNFLRENFNLPIQTIDWGHPNIRDGNLADYLEAKSSAYGREHQIKFYPEYYQEFKFRIKSKQELFLELLNHNLLTSFSDVEDWFPNSVKEIPEAKIKAAHPMENNPTLDKLVRGHFDAHWQLNLKMGCKYLKTLQDKAHNKELFAVTGIQNEIDEPEAKIANFKLIAESKKVAILSHKKEKSAEKKEKKKNSLESDTYPILVEWLEGYIAKKVKGKAYAFDTSSQTLFQFFSTKSEEIQKIDEIFTDLDNLSIRPDIVGFSDVDEDFYFIESKITSLGLKELGQIMGYCYVANPKEALLVTTKDVSATLIKAIARNRDLIRYDKTKEIKIGKLVGTEIELIEL